MDNKLSELKAAAMAATPGPWILDDDSWSDGDNANVSTEERYDGRIVSIAQIEGGGSESGFDEPFSAEQQANARYITAANPAVVLSLLAELEGMEQTLNVANDAIRLWKERALAAEQKLATPVRLEKVDSSNVPFAGDGFNAAVDYCAKAVRAAGFTVGDE